jgi:hypothetical protein
MVDPQWSILVYAGYATGLSANCSASGRIRERWDRKNPTPMMPTVSSDASLQLAIAPAQLTKLRHK